MRVLAFTLGAVLISIAVVDTIGTLVATRIQTRKWWPTALLYRYTWPIWRGFAKKIDDEDDREAFLSIYGPLSLLTLLIFWVTMQVLGWGLVWWGYRTGIHTISSLLESVYYAGIAFFTVGFGDVVPVASAPRILVLVEAFFGVTTMALLIGFMPSAFSAYSAREELVTTLDDLSGDRVTPLGMLEAYARDGNASSLYEMFERWELWTGSVLESHSTYPMLMLFRSKQSGQSWIAASVIMTETAALCVSIIDGPPDPRALRLCRRTAQMAARLENAIALEGLIRGRASIDIPEERLRVIYDRLGELGFERRPYDDVRRRIDAWHEAYLPALSSLVARLLIAPEFRLPPAVAALSYD
ncbi:MAG TPA: potassium channel family protein [Acidimicrobiales bacterium]|nr:potassium channel family protein [Acidimicrobiales bacterium]